MEIKKQVGKKIITQKKLNRGLRSKKINKRGRNYKNNDFPQIPIEKIDTIPPLKIGDIRFVPLGGVEEVGRNMTAIEYGDEIIIIDAGFGFTDDVDTPGVDYLLPNIKYLEERKEKVKAIFITHGHYDHIGAIPYIMDKIGNPPIYSGQFGSMIIIKRQEEFPEQIKLKINILKDKDHIQIGKNFKISTFAISHTIPDSMGFVINTPVGEIVFIEDVRVDNVDGVVSKEEEKQYEQFKNKKILMLTMDSTSIEKQGFSISEATVVVNLDRIIKNVTGRIVIGAFASQIERIIEIIKLAKKYNKKVIVEGRSMVTNVAIIKQLNLTDTKHLISINELGNYPPDKILMLVTGAQGEQFATLMRISNKTHKYIKLSKNDTVLISASIIPGNDRTITKLKDNLFRSEAKIITYLDSDIHATGHGNRQELEWIHKQINYKFFMPVHGHHHMLRQHAEMVESLGTPKQNIIIPDNGSVVEIRNNGKEIVKLKEKAPSYVIMVDGFAVGDTQNVVIRDRKMLAQDGIFVLIATIDARTGQLRKSPDIIARGFVYLKESQDLLNQSRLIIKKTVEDFTLGMHPINFDYVKSALTDNIARFLFQQTAKRPLVIPVILSV